jgi:two-component system response regulator ResD
MAKLLVIDDEPTVRMLVRLVFERQGYGVLEASDGATGLDLAMRTDPDIVLLDLALPEMSGIEVADRLPPRTPVLLLTGLVPDSLPEAGSQIRGYIEKPFSPASLVQRVQEVLESEPAEIRETPAA